ncbi:hypothetical protein KQ232_01235 [Lacticaseibacillus paracasei]|uniref:YopX family protein n=1 Tax=Lacticaseibacillus paracasei TaxID=1597 RepID=UPI001C1E3359|nr:YopX family protein [Lacticaseibacillus paracasei]MBU6046296.1 hypothetical protein [Lacticaseibacillus paracasei]MCL4971179.1 YopX family protein [Lacticaseibacillus paracasei]
MKREIKFRAWDKAKHRMLGVDQLAFGPNGELVSIYSDGPDFSNDSEALMGDKPDLNEAVLIQFTGLHDKNGREIYEGDILSFGSVWDNGDNEDIDEEIHIGVVEYDPHYAVYDVNCDGSGERRFLFTDVFNYDGYGVIGNIFEDKQLLEVKQ